MDRARFEHASDLVDRALDGMEVGPAPACARTKGAHVRDDVVELLTHRAPRPPARPYMPAVFTYITAESEPCFAVPATSFHASSSRKCWR